MQCSGFTASSAYANQSLARFSRIASEGNTLGTHTLL